jgi:hypothetical protein
MSTPKGCKIECVEDAAAPYGLAMYIVMDGVRIARRGESGSPQEATWVSIEPGWSVLDGKRGMLTIEYNGTRMQ